MDKREELIRLFRFLGKSEEELAAALKVFDAEGKTDDLATDANVGSIDTASDSEDGLSDLAVRQDQSYFMMPQAVHQGQPSLAPELTAEEFNIMADEVTKTSGFTMLQESPERQIDYLERQKQISKEREERVRQIKEKADFFDRTTKVKELTGLDPSQYPTLIRGGIVRQGLFADPKEATASLDKMEDMMANFEGDFNDMFKNLTSSQFQQLESYSKDPIKYEDQLDSIRDSAYQRASKKYPGLSKREFNDVINMGGDGIFRNALNNQREIFAAEQDKLNKIGGQTYDSTNLIKKLDEQAKAEDPRKLQKKQLTTLIREKERAIRDGGANMDLETLTKLSREIATHKGDIQKLAIQTAAFDSTKKLTVTKDGKTTYRKDPLLASSYMDLETTKYRRDKKSKALDKAKDTLQSDLQTTKSSNPSLTDFEAYELLLKTKGFELEKLEKAGLEEKITLTVDRQGKSIFGNASLFKKMKALGYVKDGQTGSFEVPIKKLFDAGYDARDFESFYKETVMGSQFKGLSKEDKERLNLYEDALYRVNGEIETIYDLAYVNNDPAVIDRGGIAASFVNTALEATITSFTSKRREEAIDIVAGSGTRTNAYKLEKFEEIIPEFNEVFKEEIKAGKIDELEFTEKELKAIEKSFGEEIGEGVGHFVPMLIELGILSAATGGVLSVTGGAQFLSALRSGTAIKNLGSGYQKAMYHGIQAMIEEGKMYTVGMGAGTGAGFYAGGQLTAGLTPFKNRFKYLDPLWQKVVKGGPTGAASSQLATVMEAGVKDLMGDSDFQATIDEHFGHLKAKDLIVESIVFSIVGATHIKKTDFMRTGAKMEAVAEIMKEQKELMPLEGGLEKMTPKDKKQYLALEDAKTKLQQMIAVETNAVNLDVNNPDFQKNFDARYTVPMEAAIKSVIPEYKGLEVKFVEGRKLMQEESNVAEFRENGGKDGRDLVIVDKTAKNSEGIPLATMPKVIHEFTHVAMENYFKSNPGMEAKFTKKMDKLFQKFDFSLFDGTELGEFIEKGYKIDVKTTKGKSLAAREYLAYMTELLANPEIYNQKVATSFFKEAKQEVLSIMEENFGYRPKIRNAGEFVELLGRFAQDARRGLGFQMKAARLADLEEFDFLGIEFVENNKKRIENKERLASKDLAAQKQKLIEANKELFKNKPEGWEKIKDANVAEIKAINKNIEISDRNEKNIRRFKEGEAGEPLREAAASELLKDNTPIIETWFKENFKKGLDVSESDFRSSMMEQVAKIMNSYNNFDVPFGYYLRSRLGPQLGNILRRAQAGRTTDIAMSEMSMTAEELQVADTSPELSRSGSGPEAPVGRDLVKDLNVPENVLEKVDERLSNLDISKLTYKTLKDLAPEFTNEILGVEPKAGNLGKQSVANAQKWFSNSSNARLFIDALPEGTIPMEGAPEAVKGTATGVQNVLLKEFYSKGGRAKTKAGTAVQVKIKNITPQQVKDFFGIKPDGTFVELKNDRGLSQKVKAAVDQLGKAWTNQAVRKTIESNDAMKNISNQIEAGKSEALASKILDNYKSRFPETSFEQASEDFYAMLFGGKSLSSEKRRYLSSIGIEPGLSNRNQTWLYGFMDAASMAGKSKQVRFDKDLQIAELKDITLENGEVITSNEIKSLNLKANFKMKDGNVIADVARTNRFVDNSVEFSKLLPKDIAKNLSFFDQIIFLHQRTTFENVTQKTQESRVERGKSEIKGEDGKTITNQPFTKGRSRALQVLGENTLNEIWDGIDLSFTKATAQVSGQKKYNEAKTEAERIKVIEKYFSQFSEANKAKIYNAIASTMEYYVHSGKNKAEVLSRMEWAANAMRSNSNLRLGLRQTAPVIAIYKGSRPMTDARFKLEHAKTSVKQSLTTFELIAQNKWREYGAKTLTDFVGILSPKKLLDIIDAKGGTTNMTALYRMAILEPATLAEFVTVESGGKQTLLDYVLKKGKADVKARRAQQKDVQRLEADRKIIKDKGLLADARTGRHLASKILENHDKAIELGRKKNKEAKGMSTFDFDETLIIDGENFVIAKKGNQKIKVSSGQWPIEGPKLAEQGFQFDFSDFVNVRGGKDGPLLKKMKNQIAKYGPDNVFVLTARMQEAAGPIHAWLKSKDINIPLKNITGLGKSQGEAKAQWMLEKFAEGYNDMYFVDDALPNVEAVKKVLDQLDIKSNVQQALASKDLSGGVNDIMSHSLNIAAKKVFSKAEAKVRGAKIKRRRLFMTDGAADFELLLEPLYGKGKKGIENQEWFKENIIKPFERGYNDLNNAKQKAVNGYMELRKENKDIVKSLDKEVADTSFTTDMAIRVYHWNKNGIKIPGMAKATVTKLVDYVKNDAKLQAFAERAAELTGYETGFKEPTETWWAETVANEISGVSEGVSRSKYLAEFIDAKNEIFSEENLNKMESKLGTNWRRNLEDMLDRMETGRTRSANLGEGGNAILNYLNGSVGTIMNLNTRSAMLQLISNVNFINHSFNNPLAAARAFANQPQYWKDFMTIMNSNMLKQRRAGLQINVTEAELAAAAAGSKNPAKAALAKILKAGYAPTKIADSFAIASGGATYYRNAIRKYMKEGLSKAEAEKKAFVDFQAIAERTQQSSRPDLLSAQQVSVAGRIILPFANTPMQMNRIMMKELLDLKNGRYKGAFGDNSISNKMSKVAYYGFVQSAIFAGLQSGLYALTAFGDDEELKQQKKVYAVNTIADSFLRGMGIQGAVMAGIKNAALEFQTQNNKGFGADYSEVGEDLLNISPTIGSKFTKLDAAGNTYKYNKKKILAEGLTLDGPAMQGLTMAVEAVGNVPVNRLFRKIENIRAAMDDQNETYQRVLVGLGWSKWDVGIGQREKAEEKAKEKIQKEKEKKARRCIHIKSDGRRCKNTAKVGERYCYAHK